MKFVNEKVVYVGKNEFKSKSGNNLCFLKIADPLTYESMEFLPVRDFDTGNLVSGGFYKATIHISGRYSNIELEEIK